MTPCVCHHHRPECDCELGVCETTTRSYPRALITILMLTAVVALVAARGCAPA